MLSLATDLQTCLQAPQQWKGDLLSMVVEALVAILLPAISGGWGTAHPIAPFYGCSDLQVTTMIVQGEVLCSSGIQAANPLPATALPQPPLPARSALTPVQSLCAGRFVALQIQNEALVQAEQWPEAGL